MSSNDKLAISTYVRHEAFPNALKSIQVISHNVLQCLR